MHLFGNTLHQLHKRPGGLAGGVRPFVSARPVWSTLQIGVHCLAITNDQYQADESDLGMT